MRTLVIMRHAKAVRPDGWADVDRPLTKRGHADATAAGAWLAATRWHPGVVLCSTSARTRETWQDVAATLVAPQPGAPQPVAPQEVPVRYDEAIYLASPRDLMDVVRAAPPDVATALLIGHNPGVTMLSAMLDPDGDIGDGLATSGIAVHTWDGEWVDCGPGIARLAKTHTARGSAS
jgi:phosphohistidine phosphatase